MSQQVWNFGAIDAMVASLRGLSAKFQAGNEELSAALGQGISIWEGEASGMWAGEQQMLNGRADEFKMALESYFSAVETAKGNSMATEQANAASFG